MEHIKRITYSALNPGTHLVVLGAVHGNEPCGPEGITRVIEKIENGDLKIVKGQVTFVPIVNPKAYEKNVRFVERNLNRFLYRKDTPQSYEDHIDPILCDVLDSADALLDIHSYQSEGGPFCFLDLSSQEEISFCDSLGVDYFVCGWSEAFGNSGQDSFLESMGTTEYMAFKGDFPPTESGVVHTKTKTGIATTVECGQHANANNAEIASDVIHRALSHFGMTDAPAPAKSSANRHCIKMQHVFFKEKPGQFVTPWKNCDRVLKGDVIARYDDGEEITIEEDGFIILPKASTDHPVGSEWFYFGVETPLPKSVA